VSRISLKAVILSVVLVLLLDILWSVGLVAILDSQIFAPGRSEQEIEQSLRSLYSSATFLLSGAVLGTATTIVGGYVAARISKTFPYFNGLAVGIVGTLLGIVFWKDYAFWLNLLGLIATVPAALLGAHIGARTRSTPG
jgi:lysylphosphatidylglycerol synthetase-like protein (DUF2156 family)